MFFKSRKDAGLKLALELIEYKDNSNCVVIGLPRGGVVTAFEVANALHLPLDILTPRKIEAPFNPEFAIGAVNEDGTCYLNEEVIKALHISKEYIEQQIEIKKRESLDRLKLFKKGAHLNLKGKIVLLIDDGLATGATMMAAILKVKKEEPLKIVVAVPVSHPDSVKMVEKLADEVICLFASEYFYAVGQFYENFNQVENEEVIKLLK